VGLLFFRCLKKLCHSYFLDPTLSPFATCGDRLFKYGDKKLFLRWKSLSNCCSYNILLLNVAVQQILRWLKNGECGNKKILAGQHSFRCLKILSLIFTFPFFRANEWSRTLPVASSVGWTRLKTTANMESGANFSS
jgi:hypothetical protein